MSGSVRARQYRLWAYGLNSAYKRHYKPKPPGDARVAGRFIRLVAALAGEPGGRVVKKWIFHLTSRRHPVRAM